jgi:hypothetical protein
VDVRQIMSLPDPNLCVTKLSAMGFQQLTMSSFNFLFTPQAIEILCAYFEHDFIGILRKKLTLAENDTR